MTESTERLETSYPPTTDGSSWTTPTPPNPGSRAVAKRAVGRSKSPGEPKERTPTSSMGVPGGITDKAEMWLMPKGALPAHPRYHPRWLFFKQHSDVHAVAEYLAYRIFEIIEPDFCPPVYLIRDGDGYASLMRWIGKSVRAAVEARPKGMSQNFRPREVRDLAVMTVVDALTLNSDRHEGNLLRIGGRLLPIDHGLCFWGSRPEEIWCRMRYRIAIKHQPLWLRAANTTLDVIANNKLRLVRLLNKSHAAAGKPMAVGDLTRWIAKERKRINAKGFLSKRY